MRTVLFLALAALATPVAAEDIYLTALGIALETACPLVNSVSVVDRADKSTWRVAYSSPPPQTCSDAVAAAITAFDPAKLNQPLDPLSKLIQVLENKGVITPGDLQ